MIVEIDKIYAIGISVLPLSPSASFEEITKYVKGSMSKIFYLDTKNIDRSKSNIDDFLSENGCNALTFFMKDDDGEEYTDFDDCFVLRQNFVFCVAFRTDEDALLFKLTYC